VAESALKQSVFDGLTTTKSLWVQCSMQQEVIFDRPIAFSTGNVSDAGDWAIQVCLEQATYT
jgi:hypothetical protein